jgi:hypothetical protein
MTYELKSITEAGVPAALAKAERYRLLNDPSAAESICQDVLALDPENQEALVMLLLARTDQFPQTLGAGVALAREVLPKLKDPYRRAYYSGVIAERQGKALLRSAGPGSDALAYDALREAMERYEAALAIRPKGNDEPLLRWNTCARILNARPDLAPRGGERYEPVLED